MEKTGQWERVKELFDAALEREPAERDQFLSLACGADESLRAEVDSLLSAYARSDGLSHPAILIESPKEAQALQFIGSYLLIRKLGEGGMGQVWLAEQTDPLRRQVALKLIRAGLYDDTLLARFLAERQSLALMEHPAIAKVFDAGATSEGQPYLVMEYVPGDPITKYCDQHKLNIRERLELFIKACEGVQHAHQKAIIHRDLKPANILVVDVDGRPAPRIIDFGLARAIEPQSSAPEAQNRAEVLVGTPGYMSPEQAGTADVDTRADVYSLGVVLYELLTGQQPFDAAAWRDMPITQTLQRIQQQVTVRPSVRAAEDSPATAAAAERRRCKPRELVRQLSGDLDLIATKVLEKDRQRRYGAPSELAADIRRYLRHYPVDAHAPSKGYQFRKYARRHRVGVAMTALLSLLLTGFAALQTFQLRRIARERDRANRIADFATGMFRVSDPSVARGNTVTAREILDKASKDIDMGLAKDPEMQAQLMYTMGKTYQGLGLYRQSEALFRKALETQQRVLGPNSREAAKTLNDLGSSLMWDGQFAEAEKTHRQALEILERTLGPRTVDAAKAMNNLASALVREGRYSEAAQLYRQSLDIEEKLLGPHDPGPLSAMSNLGVVEYYQGHFAEAEKLDRETIERRRQILGPDHPETLKTLNNLATLLNQEGKFGEAEKVNREVLDARSRILGPDHPDTLRSVSNLAEVLGLEGKFQEAEALDRAVLDARRSVLGPQNVSTLEAISALAAVLSDEGKPGDAEQLERQSVDGLRRMVGLDNPSTISGTISLAAFEEQNGRYREAETSDRGVLDEARRVLGADNLDTRIAMNTMALALAHEGHFVEAEALAKQAIEVENGARLRQHESYTYSTYYLGCIAALRGRRGEALSLLKKSIDMGLWPEASLAIAHDEDLRSLHGDPRFDALVKYAGARAASASSR
ncbi:MAG: serine/threonine-protein kinase [Terracidiphilus sp.]